MTTTDDLRIDKNDFATASACAEAIRSKAAAQGSAPLRVWEANEAWLAEKAQIHSAYLPYRWVGIVVYTLALIAGVVLFAQSIENPFSAESIASMAFLGLVLLCFSSVVWPILIRGIGRFLRATITILITVLLTFVALDNKRFEENFENYWTVIYLLAMTVILAAVHSLMELLWIRADQEAEENLRRLRSLHAALPLLQTSRVQASTTSQRVTRVRSNRLFVRRSFGRTPANLED